MQVAGGKFPLRGAAGRGTAMREADTLVDRMRMVGVRIGWCGSRRSATGDL